MSDFPVLALSQVTRLNDQALVDCLFSIGAPRSLVGLRYAVATIVQILDCASLHEDLRGLIGEADWRMLLEDLDSEKKLPEAIFEEPNRETSYPIWMHKSVTEHPLYTALVTPSVRTLASSTSSAAVCATLLAYGGRVFRQFGSRDLYAQSLLHSADAEWIGTDYRSSVAAASLSLRSRGKEQAAHSWLPDPAMPPNAFELATRLADDGFVKTKSDGELSDADKLSHDLAHLVQIASGMKSPRNVERQTSDGFGESEREPTTEGSLTTDRQSADEHGVITTYAMEVAPATKAEADVPAPERPVSYRTTITVIDESKNVDGELAHASADGFRRSLAADSVAKQLAKSHMDLCTAPALPTAREAQAVLAAIEENRSTLKADARRLACLIHATGRSDAQCLAARYSLSTIKQASDIEYLLDLRCWRIRIAAPAHEDTALWDTAVCRPWQDFALLPDLVRAGDRLGVADGGELVGKAIVRSGKTALQSLNKSLKAHPSGPRKLRSEWIRKSTRRRLHAACNDDLPAALIYAGRRRNTETTIHYSSPEARFIEALYCRAFEANEPTVPLNPKGVCVGSKLCPTDTYIQKWVKHAKRILRRTRKGNLALCHRIYVRYVALMVIHACALRATKDPHPDLIDPELLIAIIDDKSRRPGQSTRLQVLPAVVLELLRHYETHRLEVLRKYGDLGKSPAQYPYFFDLRDGEIVELAPSHFREAIEGLSFPIPPGSMRRHMRTRLMESGIDAQMIDPAMSHFRSFTSPQAKTSTYPWLAAMREVEKTVSRLIAGLGWTALPGYRYSA